MNLYSQHKFDKVYYKINQATVFYLKYYKVNWPSLTTKKYFKKIKKAWELYFVFRK